MTPPHQNKNLSERSDDLLEHPTQTTQRVTPPLASTLNPPHDMSADAFTLANADVMYDEIADEELDLHGDDSYIYGEDYDDDGTVEVYAPTDVPPLSITLKLKSPKIALKGKMRLPTASPTLVNLGKRSARLSLMMCAANYPTTTCLFG